MEQAKGQITKFCTACRVEHPIEHFGSEKGVSYAAPICKAVNRRRSQKSYAERAMRIQTRKFFYDRPAPWELDSTEYLLKDVIFGILLKADSDQSVTVSMEPIDGGEPRDIAFWVIYHDHAKELKMLIDDKITPLPWDLRIIYRRVRRLGLRVGADPNLREALLEHR